MTSHVFSLPTCAMRSYRLCSRGLPFPARSLPPSARSNRLLPPSSPEECRGNEECGGSDFGVLGAKAPVAATVAQSCPGRVPRRIARPRGRFSWFFSFHRGEEGLGRVTGVRAAAFGSCVFSCQCIRVSPVLEGQLFQVLAVTSHLGTNRLTEIEKVPSIRV